MKIFRQKPKAAILIGLCAVPWHVSAQVVEDSSDATFRSVVNNVTGLFQLIIPVLVGAAVLVFAWGMADYIMQAGDESAVEDGRQRIIAGIIGLFVISAIWGVIEIVGGTFSLF